jgi:hypothetical protein
MKGGCQRYLTNQENFPNFEAESLLSMENYLERFKRMVEELRGHPDVILTRFLIFPPASEHLITRVDRHLGMELHESIKSFYRQTNGLQLQWMHRKDPKFDPYRHYALSEVPLTIQDILQDDGHHTACVNILPMPDVFLNEDMWEGLVWFDPQDEERKQIHPFDLFNFYYDMAFILGDQDPDPTVTLGTDHLASHDDGFDTRFETYMEFILLQKGWVDARHRGFWNSEWADETRYELSDFQDLQPLVLNNIPFERNT